MLSKITSTFRSSRLVPDRQSSGRNTTLTPSRILIAGFIYFGLIVPAYSYAYFAPSIIRGYGYSPIQTQLHSVPPWAVAFAFSMLVATCSDWLRHRFMFTVVPICISIAGFAILLNVHRNTQVMYGALFLVTSGTYSAMPIVSPRALPSSRTANQTIRLSAGSS